jgi:acyl-CoA dehydrogenase
MFWIVLFIAAFFILSYHRASLPVFTISFGVLTFFLTFLSAFSIPVVIATWLVFLLIFVPINIIPLRRFLISKPLFEIFRKVMPKMSVTEKQALLAGSNEDWTADLFSGMPDWQKFQALPWSRLTAEEQAFLDGPVAELCGMIDAWSISRSMQIPEIIWSFLKREGFFGLIIPKQYGGKEFSAAAHSAVLVKIASVSSAVSTVVCVPNSLGPGELILAYGTEQQKNYYLPRLAGGEEIPCFALTSPVAGSDAAAITDYGIVCREIFEGKEQLCVRLNWDKRYITLAPIATLLGLAFKLYDPECLLSEKKERGITCALVPTSTAGIRIGRRHYPLDSAFPNGPTQGHNVLIPVDWIIGGVEMVGRGWRMLMECLAAGRSISLPSMVCGNARKAALTSGGYARIRRQFNSYIGCFGGIEEALARLAKNTYIVDAVRSFTISAVDQHQKPAVASAITKYHTTELGRSIMHDAMDIHGGKGICMGPKNYLAQGYIEGPISITVEGANILTRSMIIFGQGVIRCHPFVFAEMMAAQNSDAKTALETFDKALFGHIGFFVSNLCRSLWLGVTHAYFVAAPASSLKRYFQVFTRYSAILALTADVCLLTVGGKLKRMEKLSGRLGDLLSFLYMGSAVAKYYENSLTQQNQQTANEIAVVEYACKDLIFQFQERFDSLLRNFPNRFIAGFLRMVTLPLGKRFHPVSDRRVKSTAQLLLHPSVLRDQFKQNLYMFATDNNPLGMIEKILQQIIDVEDIEKKIEKAKKMKIVSGKNLKEWIQSAIENKVISTTEAEQLLDVDSLRMKIINVDDFSEDDLKFHHEHRSVEAIKEAFNE